MFKLLIQLVFFFFLKVHLMFDFNKLQVKYKHFLNLQIHAQNSQRINDEDFYEFLFLILIFILLCFYLKLPLVLFLQLIPFLSLY